MANMQNDSKFWAKMRREYATGEKSVRELARKYKVSESTASKRAITERWRESRLKYRKALEQKAHEYSVDHAAKELADIAAAANRLSDRCLSAVSDDQQFNRYLVPLKGASIEKESGEEDPNQCRILSEWTEEQIFNKLDTKAMRDIAATLKDLTALLRSLYGIPTYMEQQQMDMARERLNLDKRKVDNELNDGGREITVCFKPVSDQQDAEDLTEDIGEAYGK